MIKSKPQVAQDMFTLQCLLEESITTHLADFERKTGLSVHSIKVFRGDPVNGRRITIAVEVSAMLR